MLKGTILSLITGLTLFYSTLSLASDEHGRYWIYGVGRQSCKTYLEARKTGGFSEISYKNWVSGYLTSSNRSSDDTYNLLGNTDFEGAMDWLDKHCRKNPKNTVYMAMANLVAVMYPNRRESK